jgi:hypothetical protein
LEVYCHYGKYFFMIGGGGQIYEEKLGGKGGGGEGVGNIDTVSLLHFKVATMVGLDELTN